jgi:hypothetical protein
LNLNVGAKLVFAHTLQFPVCLENGTGEGLQGVGEDKLSPYISFYTKAMNPNDLPDFPLEPWELPPDSTESLVAPATMRWRGILFGRETDWLVRLVRHGTRHKVVVRAEHESCDHNWKAGIWAPVIQRRFGTIDRYLQQWTGPPQRIIYLREEFHLWELLARKDASSICTVPYEDNPIGEDFSSTWPFDFLSATATQVHDEVLRWWNDETCDLNFARRWVLMDEDEKYALLVSWKRGGQKEFLAAMQSVLRAFSRRIPDRWSQWAFYPTSHCFGYVEVIEGELNDEVEPPAALPIWGAALVEVFGPRWNEELTRQHPCARDQHSHGGSHFIVHTSGITAHEQLEAARELSLWLDERQARGELDETVVAQLRDMLR